MDGLYLLILIGLEFLLVVLYAVKWYRLIKLNKAEGIKIGKAEIFNILKGLTIILLPLILIVSMYCLGKVIQ